MITRLIEVCARNRFLVLATAALVVFGGVWSLRHTALDALPDISDVQVVVHTTWTGEPPNLLEDQVTYPLVTSFLSTPRVSSVRAQTMLGDSYVYVVFQDNTDLYWARSRVLEQLEQIAGALPKDVHPAIGPDATGAGWVYEYALVDRSHRRSLADLRSLQDWFLRYQLETVPGVAEVASIGGFVRQYQVNLDPERMRAYGIPLGAVIAKVQASTQETGGRTMELSGARYIIRGLGYVQSLADLRQVAVGVHQGIPVQISDLGTVSLGPDIREGAADWNGEGETVGGIVVMRDGMNALDVIRGVKQKLAELQPSLPAGVRVEAGYDRSGLIEASIGTLRRDLVAEALIVSLVILLFLFHFRSALIPVITLPIAVLATFLVMGSLHVTSNIMSLGGLALAIGVLVDAAIVIVENGYRHLSEHPGASGAERREIIVRAATQVGPALFFSLLIIVASFLPIFLLTGQEGRMFAPLAWTKTLAVGSASIMAVTLVPVLMLLLLRGRLRPESVNPISRLTQAVYRPVLRWCLRHRALTLAANLAFLAFTIPLAFRIGSQFMPPLFEGSALYMPTGQPGLGITTATQLLQEQDRILRAFPEVASVFGTVGRSDSATDNAPLEMYDTTIMLKPREQWPAGMNYAKLIASMDAKLQFPGLTNNWTMPVENRLDMELTGIKTPIGMKIQGPNLEGIQALGANIERILAGTAGLRSTYAERTADGFYLNIAVDREQAARYGLSVADVQQAVSSGIGGANIAETIEGRARYPISVRYSRDYRDNLPALRQVLVATPAGAQIPLGAVATLSYSRGPAMIRDEDGQLTGYVYLDVSTNDYGGFVRRAQARLERQLKMPAGYHYAWSGEYAAQLHAQQRLRLIVPLVVAVIFLLLYMVFHSLLEVTALIIPTVFALSGGLLLQWWLGYEFSVAAWVGYIALFGIAVETGVVMVVYLHEAMERRRQLAAENGTALSRADIEAAVMEGAVQRLRPKLMTVCAVLASLIPILAETGIGSDVMKPIAAPIVGGMITSTLHVLILIPVLFATMMERRLGVRHG
ncbi:MAG TPA: CusA/CzcA family heavy metal efflux RND transporter [Terriglobales bacterium]|nr:CusA/CzcA family heavy metal efflux RND transporter [Terriglobales bacterium]